MTIPEHPLHAMVRRLFRRGTYLGEVSYGFTKEASELDFLASMAMGWPIWLFGVATPLWAILDFIHS